MNVTLKNEKAPQRATERIIKALERDISDRMGLKQEWHAIDAKTKKEIRATWRVLILNEIARELSIR